VARRFVLGDGRCGRQSGECEDGECALHSD
jgi:hypothetical protein